MQLQKYAIILLITLTVFYTGCKKPSVKSEQPSAAAATVDTSELKTTVLNDAEANNLTLRYKPEEGKTFYYRLTSVTEETGKIIADTTLYPKSLQTVTYSIQVKANDIEDDGTVDALFTVSAVKLSVDMDGKKIEYFSGDKNDQSKREKFLEYEGIINNTFGARVKSNGEILELYKTDKIINRLLSLRKISRDTIPAQEIEAFEQSIVMSGLRPIVRQVFREFSKGPVSKNSIWDVAQQPMNLQVVAFENKAVHTFNGVEQLGSEKLANIAIKLEAKSMQNPELAKRKMSVSKSTLTGDGKLYFNLNKGMFQKNKTIMVLALAMKGVAPTAKGLQNYSTDKTTTSTYYLELLDVK